MDFKFLWRQFLQKKKLIHNFGYMSIVEVLNILVPLTIYPYLIKVLGVDVYGRIIFAQVIVSYCSIFINYGFNIEAVKEVSLLRRNRKALNTFVSSVFIAKFFLWVSSFIILLLGCLIIDREFLALYLLTFLMTFNEFIFPTWFFQGIEKMKFVTLINTVGRVLYLISIIFLIKSDNDYLLVPVLNGGSIFIASLVGLFLMIYRENIRFEFVSFREIVEVLKKSSTVFLSQAIISVKDKTSQIIIGAVLGMTEVAIFDLGMRVSNVIVKLPVIINQVIFPRVAQDKNMNFVLQVSHITFLLLLTVISLLWYFTPMIVAFLGGDKLAGAETIIRILLFCPIFLSYSSFFGTNCLLVFNKKLVYMRGMLLTTIFYILLISVAYFSGIINNVVVVSVITVLVYLFEMIYRGYFSKKLKLI